MVGQMIRRLWEAEQLQQQNGSPQRFTIVVTGDHSTPIMFGDHSHEPVPFAVAHLQHVVSVDRVLCRWSLLVLSFQLDSGSRSLSTT